MSIETDIGRIATALEGLLAIAQGDKTQQSMAPAAVAEAKPSKTAAKVQAVPKTKTAPISPVVEAATVVPAVEDVDDQGPGQFDEPSAPPAVPEVEGLPTTPEALVAFAGLFLNAAPEGDAQMLVAYIRNSVAAKFSPANPRLRNVPAKNIVEAAKMIQTWCAGRGINITKGV